jgi:hypothetical protein
MKVLLMLVPLMLFVGVAPIFIASCGKLAAFILGRRVVPWKTCILFGYLTLLLSIVMRVLSRVLPFDIPLFVALIIGFLVWFVAGSLFFSTRAAHVDGAPLGVRRAGEIAALSWLFVASTGGLFYWLATVLIRSTAA